MEHHPCKRRTFLSKKYATKPGVRLIRGYQIFAQNQKFKVEVWVRLILGYDFHMGDYGHGRIGDKPAIFPLLCAQLIRGGQPTRRYEGESNSTFRDLIILSLKFTGVLNTRIASSIYPRFSQFVGSANSRKTASQNYSNCPIWDVRSYV